MSSFSQLAEINPDALTCDGLDEAFVGYTAGVHGTVAVYDYHKAVEVWMKEHGSTYEEAAEFIDFNTISAYVGKNTPIFVVFSDDSEVEVHTDDRK